MWVRLSGGARRQDGPKFRHATCCVSRCMSITERLTEILREHDPVGIYFPDWGNEDEYAPEANAIAEGLPRCGSGAQCLDLVYGTFVQFFGAGIAGNPDRYVAIAADVWAMRFGHEGIT